MTDLIVSAIYIISLVLAIAMPVIIGHYSDKAYILDKEDEILHELTACRED